MVCVVYMVCDVYVYDIYVCMVCVVCMICEVSVCGAGIQLSTAVPQTASRVTGLKNSLVVL